MEMGLRDVGKVIVDEVRSENFASEVVVIMQTQQLGGGDLTHKFLRVQCHLVRFAAYFL
jgi:hypothetical protein